MENKVVDTIAGGKKAYLCIENNKDEIYKIHSYRRNLK